MQFRVNSNDLLKKITSVAGFVPSKSVLPIIQGIHLKLSGGVLYFAATDLEHSIQTRMRVECEPDAELSIVVPVKILSDTLKSLGNETLDISVSDCALQIKAERSKFKINGQNGDDFPAQTFDKNGLVSFNIPTAALVRAIQSTVFAVSKDELKPAMTGVYVRVERELLTCVATDAHCLVRYKYLDFVCDLPDEDPFKSVILSEKTLKQIVADAPNCESDVATISFDAKSACIVLGEILISSRLIDARFPAYENVIPAESPKRVIMQRSDLLAAVKRMGIYASKNTRLIKCTFNELSLDITADFNDTADAGAHSARETISCLTTGELDENGVLIEIGFNATLCAQLCDNVPNEEVVFQMDMPGRCAVITPAEQMPGEHLDMVLMPIMLGAKY